jgi:hypothetical protein
LTKYGRFAVSATASMNRLCWIVVAPVTPISQVTCPVAPAWPIEVSERATDSPVPVLLYCAVVMLPEPFPSVIGVMSVFGA